MKDEKAEKFRDKDHHHRDIPRYGGGKGGAADRRLLLGLLRRPNCAAEMKLFLVAALLLCSLFTLFFRLSPAATNPSSAVISAAENPSAVISAASDSKSAVIPPYPPSPQQNATQKRTFNPNISAATTPTAAISAADRTPSVISATKTPTAAVIPPQNATEKHTFNPEISAADSNSAVISAADTDSPPPQNGTLKRTFHPIGTAAYSFILMSAYRGGAATFSVIGLASKPLHVFGRPIYTCEYQSSAGAASTAVAGAAILPDWGYGRVYTTVVVTCTFPSTSPAAAFSGGRLLLHVTTNGGFDTAVNLTTTITALSEAPNSWELSKFSDQLPKYDFFYCGSPLYGDLSPQRVREWVAHHARLFGRRAHFVFYDAGGVHVEVMEVLRPWIELGYVTVHDIREQERFDGYYHNQFLVVNDCLHRYRFDAKWMFFFDVDEYIYVEGGSDRDALRSVMGLYENYTQITISQMLMSSKLCRAEDEDHDHQASKKWGFEKLVFRDVKRVPRRNRKYAIQPRNVFATGVHLSKNIVGESTYPPIKLIRYFHYHGTISLRHDPCRQFVNETSAKIGDTPYTLDMTMKSLASKVKEFELATIGSRLQGIPR